MRTKQQVLAESPLFDNLLPPELELIAELCVDEHYEAGDVVFNQGDVGDTLFIIVDGEVDVVRSSDEDGGEETTLATLTAPQFFGEMSLIDKEYRSASIRARTSATLLLLTNDNLHTFAKTFRNGFTWIVVNISRVLSHRLREANRMLAAVTTRVENPEVDEED